MEIVQCIFCGPLCVQSSVLCGLLCMWLYVCKQLYVVLDVTSLSGCDRIVTPNA